MTQTTQTKPRNLKKVKKAESMTLRLMLACWMHKIPDSAVARVVKVHRITVLRWRHGKGEMTATQWAKIAHTFSLGRMTIAPHKRKQDE